MISSILSDHLLRRVPGPNRSGRTRVGRTHQARAGQAAAVWQQCGDRLATQQFDHLTGEWEGAVYKQREDVLEFEPLKAIPRCAMKSSPGLMHLIGRRRVGGWVIRSGEVWSADLGSRLALDLWAFV